MRIHEQGPRICSVSFYCCEPDALSFLFISPNKIEIYPHTTWQVIFCVGLEPPHLSDAPPPHTEAQQMQTGKGPLESFHATSFFDFCQPTLQVFSKVTYYLCGCEETLCSSRVCEITWNRIESCSGKAIAVRISYVTKTRPGFNDVIYTQLYLMTLEAICWAPTHATAMTLSPSP